MDQLPPLTALRAFEMAGRHLNVARAAQELGVSPGAVSQQIHALEKWLGCRLFRRSNRGLAFTDAGESYHAAIADCLMGVRRATLAVSRPDVRKQFVISATASFAMKWLLPRLSRFRELWPGLDISLSTVELIGTFSAADGDVGIRYGMGDHPGMKSWEVISDDLILVAAPGLLPSEEQNVLSQDLLSQELLAHPLLVDRHSKLIADYPSWEEYLKSRGLTLLQSLRQREFSQQWMVIEAAINGEGIALVKSCLVAEDLKQGKLQQLSDDKLRLLSGYYLVCLPENATDRVLQSFRKWIARECGHQE
ncbi:LysR substrate-binding domain-containing protein [Rhodovibrionaceae bacterium A322]